MLIIQEVSGIRHFLSLKGEVCCVSYRAWLRIRLGFVAHKVNMKSLMMPTFQSMGGILTYFIKSSYPDLFEGMHHQVQYWMQSTYIVLKKLR